MYIVKNLDNKTKVTMLIEGISEMKYSCLASTLIDQNIKNKTNFNYLNVLLIN